MNLIFLAFANHEHSPLPHLQEEADGIYRSLMPRALKQQLLLHQDPFTTIEKIAEYITLVRDHLFLFHFSGHAGKDALLLDEAASATGIRHLLSQCPHLKVVVLNGCSTKGQVEQLLDAGIPIVIATSAPVEDPKAMRFGKRFFKALADGATIGESFELAVAEVLVLDGSMEKMIHRDFVLDDEPPETGTWGIYHKPEQKEMLDLVLPTEEMKPTPTDFEPNTYFIQGLLEGLAPYNDDVSKEMKRKRPKPAKQRLAILNSLPAPIAEHLRKLMAPVTEEEEEGFDKISVLRLEQIVRTYQVVMELITFALMGEIWETAFKKGSLKVTPDQENVVGQFLMMPPNSEQTFNFTALIRNLCEINLRNDGEFFIEELDNFNQMLTEESEFQQASNFLEVLKIKVYKESVSHEEVGELCRRGEESLTHLIARFGFLTKFTLVSVQSIDVIKYRHLPETEYNHIAVELKDLLGSLDLTDILSSGTMFNKSVLLWDEDEERYLNLSPFIIDANAFEEKDRVTTIYFLSHLVDDQYCFKWISNPEDESSWIIASSDSKYEIINDQIEAFRALIDQNPSS